MTLKETLSQIYFEAGPLVLRLDEVLYPSAIATIATAIRAKYVLIPREEFDEAQKLLTDDR